MLADVIVRAAGAKGKGVFALRDFTQGSFIFRRRHGRVVANSDIISLSQEDQQHLCELDWSTSAVLLPPGCYLNHSCDPYAIRSDVNVYAWRNIQAGESSGAGSASLSSPNAHALWFGGLSSEIIEHPHPEYSQQYSRTVL
jgi:hypothetical protein